MSKPEGEDTSLYISAEHGSCPNVDVENILESSQNSEARAWATCNLLKVTGGLTG
jgi:hypothetical protein